MLCFHDINESTSIILYIIILCTFCSVSKTKETEKDTEGNKENNCLAIH